MSSSLDFTSQITSLMAKPGTATSASASSAAKVPSSSAGRARPSKSKDVFFPGVRIKRKERRGRADAAVAADGNKLRLKSPTGTEEEKAELARARRKLEEKARVYAAMKRGEHVAKEGEATPLVDFDRKWAERQQRGEDTSSDAGSGSYAEADADYKDTEVIEYTDEFGRLRRGTRADKMREERRAMLGALSAHELERMSARPKAPQSLIHGDAVQAEAFTPDDPEAMAALARRRDRSLTPPEHVHYEADREIRTRGTGFYAFSKDEATRDDEMKNLGEERDRTEAARRERQDKVAARKREVDARRQEIEARRKGNQREEGPGHDRFLPRRPGERPARRRWWPRGEAVSQDVNTKCIVLVPRFVPLGYMYRELITL